ncbi:MAG: polysaccharide biosynthesis protein, partial [Mariprofundaceae bacterium]|nr:polysaccharide biosynthesis protein [Mariprofundaceae bacterium]
LAHTLTRLLGRPEHKISIIGTRHGEKLYEALLTREEMVSAEDMGDYYRIPADTRDLNYAKYFDEGEVIVTQASEYHSHNTRQLTATELEDILSGLHEIQDDLKEFNVNTGKNHA